MKATRYITIDVMTLFPEMCDSVLSQSIIGRAIERGILSVETHQIRDFTKNRQRQVDDYPYGGGKGMVMNAQPIMDCYREICRLRFNERLEPEPALNCENPEPVEKALKPYTVYMSPKGQVLTQSKAIELSKKKNLCILCGHYEGVDQRVLDEIVDEEVSIGDYVLTGGELPALVMIDAVARMLPGVLSDEVCFTDESHYGGLLEHPHYTRPEVWEGKAVPPVLLTGHHANIEKWRRKESLKITALRRPDMIKKLASAPEIDLSADSFDESCNLPEKLSYEELKFLIDVMSEKL